MNRAIAVQTDFTTGEIRQFAKRARDAAQARRLLAIVAVLDGDGRATRGALDRELRYPGQKTPAQRLRHLRNSADDPTAI